MIRQFSWEDSPLAIGEENRVEHRVVYLRDSREELGQVDQPPLQGLIHLQVLQPHRLWDGELPCRHNSNSSKGPDLSGV